MARSSLPFFLRPGFIAAFVGATLGFDLGTSGRGFDGDDTALLAALFAVEFLGALVFFLWQPPRIGLDSLLWAGIGCSLGFCLTPAIFSIILAQGRPSEYLVTAFLITLCIVVQPPVAMAGGALVGLMLRGLVVLTRDGVRALWQVVSRCSRQFVDAALGVSLDLGRIRWR